LFSEKVVPLLANRGANLTKDDLENKRKVDQELFTTVILEYNDESNASYGLHAFKDVPQKVDPSVFKKNPVNAWRHALDKFKKYCQGVRTTYQGLDEIGKPWSLRRTLSR